MFPLPEEVAGESMLMVDLDHAAGLLGIAIAYYMYVVNTAFPDKIASALGGLYIWSTTSTSSTKSTTPPSSTR